MKNLEVHGVICGQGYARKSFDDIDFQKLNSAVVVILKEDFNFEIIKSETIKKFKSLEESVVFDGMPSVNEFDLLCNNHPTPAKLNLTDIEYSIMENSSIGYMPTRKEV